MKKIMLILVLILVLIFLYYSKSKTYLKSKTIEEKLKESYRQIKGRSG